MRREPPLVAISGISENNRVLLLTDLSSGYSNKPVTHENGGPKTAASERTSQLSKLRPISHPRHRRHRHRRHRHHRRPPKVARGSRRPGCLEYER